MLKLFNCFALNRFVVVSAGNSSFTKISAIQKKMFLTTTKNIFYSPTRGNFGSKCFVPACQFKLKHFLLNWHFSCKCHFNAIFNLKWQFWNETFWYESIFVSKCQNVILLKMSKYVIFSIPDLNWKNILFCFIRTHIYHS